MRGKSAVALLALLLVVQDAAAFNILALTAVRSRSHFTFLTALTTTLLERGHRVFELLPVAAPKHPNRTSFAVGETMYRPDFDLAQLAQRSDYDMSYGQARFSIANCEATLKSQAAANLLALARDPKRRPKIDVVLLDYMFGQCAGVFAKEFGSPPIVVVTAFGNPVEIDQLLGGPTFPTFVPHDTVTYSRFELMTWYERLRNKFVYLLFDYHHWSWMFPKMEEQMREVVGDSAATIEEINNNVALALVNSHPTMQGSRPQLPSVIEVAGLHIPPVKQIPSGKLRDFVESAKNGFILMSFGSVLRASAMESWRRQELMRAFGKLNPVRVVFKWDDPWDPTDGPVPSNVFLSPWLPQNDILAHRNIRLFVTHCGILSTTEILSRAVPAVAVPLFVDQFLNANNLVAMNVARMLPYQDLREDSFYNVTVEVLNDKRYVESARRISALLKDQLVPPKELAVFWVEFVARHKGAPHLRSPAQLLPWVARWMVDDVLIFTVLLVGFMTAIGFLRKLCIQVRSGTEKLKHE